MEVRDMIDFYNIPEEIRLEDIKTSNIKEARLLNRLMVNNINTIADLKQNSDEDLMRIKYFSEGKLEKLREFLTDWYEDDLVVENHIRISDVNTVITSLQEDVFGTYKNLMILALRGNYLSYGKIGEQLEQSRQGIQENERTVHKDFMKWYRENDLSDKIGNYNDFYLYCEKNFPDDQRDMKIAVRKLVELAKIYEKRKSQEIDAALAENQ